MVLDALLPKEPSADPKRQQCLIWLVGIGGPPIQWPLKSGTEITRMRIIEL